MSPAASAVAIPLLVLPVCVLDAASHDRNTNTTEEILSSMAKQTKAQLLAEIERGLQVNRTQSNRGFQVIEFLDRYKNKCSLQQSSLADHERPGTSAVWLGIEDAKPQILAEDAVRFGVNTGTKGAGWVPYPIPEEVFLSTRMHLDVQQVQWLIHELQVWLRDGKFKA